MPYNCTLTSTNKFVYEYRIYELIDVFNKTHNDHVLNFIIVAILEYVLAVTYINTSVEVRTKQAIRDLNVSERHLGLVYVMKRIRDVTVHSPCNLTLSIMKSMREASTLDTVKWLLTYFTKKPVVGDFFSWVASNYGVYPNITTYCDKLNISLKEFDDDKLRLMNLLDAYTYADLNEKIVALL